MMRKLKTIWTLVGVGALAALFLVCLGLMWQFHSLWKASGYPLKEKSNKRAMTEMEAARNADTSNFDNVLKF